MNLIASVTSDWGIGNNGRLLVKNPKDMDFFKSFTAGKTVICGRKTFESIPNRPLKRRKTIVVTRNTDYTFNGVEVINDIYKLKDYNRSGVVIGGGEIYSKLLPYCQFACITMNYIHTEADTFLENLDKNSNWLLVYKTDHDLTPDGVEFEFRVYKNTNCKMDIPSYDYMEQRRIESCIKLLNMRYFDKQYKQGVHHD